MTDPIASKSGRVMLAPDKKPDRILVVEDSANDQELMQRRLNNTHAKIDLAEDLDQAYRVASENKPEVIVLDPGVPRRSGSPKATMDDLLEFVRFHKSEQCVVVITGNNDVDETDIVQFYEAGALDYISKDIIAVGMELQDRVLKAYQSYLIAKEGSASARLYVELSKVVSRQDKVFMMIRRLVQGVTTVRESEHRLIYDQAFKAGGAAKEKEIKERRLLKHAATAGGTLGALLVGWHFAGDAWQVIIAFFKGFAKVRGD